tara:strand:- start:701 stop:1624 length:924 start_codon:yes stop_codon:yes gene_type:complete
MKIKFLTLAIITTALLSCGESKENSNSESESIESESIESGSIDDSSLNNSEDLDLISYVHGIMFSNQLKNQKLPFINPEDMIKDFNEFKKNGLGNFNPDEAIAELRKIAELTQNFASLEGTEMDRAKSIFSKLYYKDINQSPIADQMNFEKFEEGMLTYWKDGKLPSQDSITIFTNFMRNAIIKIGDDFLAENSRNENVTVTPSGLQYEVLEEGNGESPSDTSIVLAHYEGKLLNGQKFDSSYDRGEPSEFPLNGVIAGWTEGLQLMQVGAKYKFYIPYNLGYGERGTRGIPPFSTLIFTVELKDIR